MSLDRNYYVIAGYDLTKYKTDKYREWHWTDDGQEFTCYQRRGCIQLFDDPMMGGHLYLGYIFAAGDEYEFKSQKIDLVDVEIIEPKVNEVLWHLQEVGVITEDIDIRGLTYEMIAFEEDT